MALLTLVILMTPVAPVPVTHAISVGNYQVTEVSPPDDSNNIPMKNGGDIISWIAKLLEWFAVIFWMFAVGALFYAVRFFDLGIIAGSCKIKKCCVEYRASGKNPEDNGEPGQYLLQP